MNQSTAQRICQDPKVMAGQPVIRGTRITVALILRELGRGATPGEIVDPYPHLTIDDVRGVARYPVIDEAGVSEQRLDFRIVAFALSDQAPHASNAKRHGE